MHVNRQLNEKLDWISEGSSLDERVHRIRTLINNDAIFFEFMKMSVVPEMKLVGLPSGMPDTYKPETDLPDGIADSTARQEFRRIKNFLSNGTMQSLPAAKRESHWIQMLEGMHWKEAQVMIQIKDQTLLQAWPNLREVFAQIGLPTGTGLETESSKPAKKGRKPKAS